MNKVKGKNIYTDTTTALDTASSVASTVSFNSSNWNRANKEADDLSKIIASGLLAAGETLKTSKSDVTIDDRGIIVSNTPESKYPNDRIFIGDSQILFSDDAFQTINTALGRVQYTKQGVTYNDFGLIAHLVLAGYIGGSVIEGSEIYGGILQSTNYSAGKTGTKIDLNKGTFEFNAGNETKLTLDEKGVLTAKGTIKAEKGWIGGQNAFVIEDGKIYCRKNSLTSSPNGIYIGTDGIALGANNVLKLSNDGTFYAEKGYLGGTGGFVLERNKLYHGKSSISDDKAGIYLGTDGIALGKDSKFKVTTNGVITAISGTIGGATIQSDSIRASNGKWRIDSDGKAHFEDVYIDNVHTGSSFGGVSLDTNGTYGAFENGFLANSSFVLNGGALQDFNNSVEQKISVDYINDKLLKCKNLFTDGKINVDGIETQNIKTNGLNAYDLKANNISVTDLTVNGKHANWKWINIITSVGKEFAYCKDINGNNIRVVIDVPTTQDDLYVMIH